MTLNVFAYAALMLLCAGTLFAADAAPAPSAGGVRELDIKGLKIVKKKGQPDAPTAIKSATELQEAVPDAEAQKKIQEAVSFEKEQLVLFVWAGSGQDRVSAAAEQADGKENVVFTYRPGRTRDYRPHQQLFALPAAATWRVVTERP